MKPDAMQLIAPGDYAPLLPSIKASGMRGHLALVYQVLEGQQGGRVFADDAENPRTAVVCNANGFYFGFGDPHPERLAEVVEALWQEQRADIYAGLFGSHRGWDEALRQVMEPYGVEPSERLAFEWHADAPPAAPPPPGYQIADIDEQTAGRILDGSGTHNYGIDPWFIRTAGGASAYAALQLGLAVVHEGQIVSIAGVCGLGGGEVELEVGTVPAYQGCGLGQMVTAAFMAQCIQRGLRPAYSCGVRNLPSIAIARKLGFVEIETIRGYPLYAVNEG